MDTVFFKEDVHLGKDALSILIDDHLLEDDYNNYNHLKDDLSFYSEPFLNAHYHCDDLKKYPLDQLLFGYFKNNQGVKKIEVKSDAHGVIYLPEIGYFITSLKEQLFYLLLDENQKITLVHQNNGEEVLFEFEKLVYLSQSSIEVLTHSHEYLLHKIKFSDHIKLIAKDLEVPRDKISHYYTTLNKGYDIIRKVDTAQYDEIEKLVKRITFFDCGYFMNFTSMDFQGTIFISTYDSAKPLTFIDTLIHETSHLALNLILIDPEVYFTIDPFELRFNSPFFEESKKRGLYHSIHATYVLTKLVRFYNTLYDSKELKGIEEYELLGLFLLDIKLLGEALSYIDDPDLYTDKGNALFQEMKNLYETVCIDKKEIIDTYKIPVSYNNVNASVTPKNFEVDDFLKINKIAV